MNLKNLFAKLFSLKRPHPEPNNLTSGKTFDEKLNDIGCFQYDDEGFSINYGDFSKKMKWDEITEINVYKADLMTIDRIEMEIVYTDKMFMISEDLPGWYQFVIKTKSIFPSIPNDWDMEIVQPPFATNYRTIYSKG
ncbi:hypothetical protein [Lacibacter sp. H407]|uniref:hypothetical protein n=1 Tax=Lacibacter sp. H407 TaxID=3133423 RepID=UPI0030C1ABDD